MNTFKFSVIVDIFFIFFSSLFFFYALFLYSVGGYALSLTLSVIISIFISSIFALVTLLKGEVKFLKEKEINLLKAFNYKLYIMPIKDILSVLENYYKSQNKSVTVYENYIVLKDENSKIFPIIKPEEVSLSDIVKVYNIDKNNYKSIIIGTKFNENAEVFIEELSLNITLFKTEELYSLLKEQNLLPKDLQLKSVKKKRLINIFKGIFIKKHAKRFLFSGVIIIFTSFFSFYPLYYIIVGGILMITSVILRLFGKNQNLVQN